MVSTIIDTRLLDYVMIIIMVVGFIFACMIGFTIMNMVFGTPAITYWEQLQQNPTQLQLMSNEVDAYLLNMTLVISK